MYTEYLVLSYHVIFSYLMTTVRASTQCIEQEYPHSKNGRRNRSSWSSHGPTYFREIAAFSVLSAWALQISPSRSCDPRSLHGQFRKALGGPYSCEPDVFLAGIRLLHETRHPPFPGHRPDQLLNASAGPGKQDFTITSVAVAVEHSISLLPWPQYVLHVVHL